MQKPNPRLCLSTFASVMTMAVAAPLSAQTAAEIEFRAGGVAATDPYLVGTDESDALALRFEVLPALSWEDETSIVRIAGDFSYEEWLNRYDSDVSGGASLFVQEQASETLRLFADVSYRTRERASPELIGSSLSTDDLSDVDEFVFQADPSIDREFQRRQSASASFGAEKRVSTTALLRAQLSTNANWFEGEGRDYRTTNLDTSIVQQISPRAAIIIGLGGSISDYLNQESGDGKFGNATLGFELSLSETGVLTAVGGVGVADIDNGFGSNESRTFFIADVSLCEQIASSRICASASRETRPTAIGGASTVTSAQLGWKLALGADEDLSVNASFSRSDANMTAFDSVEVAEFKIAATSIRYSVPITDALGFYIAPSAAKIFDDPRGRDENFQLLFGLSYRFGG